MAGLPWQPVAVTHASPEIQGSQARRMPRENTVGARPYQASSGPEISGHLVHEPPADSAVADLDLGHSGGGGDPLQDERSGQDHVGASGIEADDPSRAACVPTRSRAICSARASCDSR